MRNKFYGLFLLAIMLFCLGAEGKATEPSSEEGKLHVLVERQVGSGDNPFHSEFIINGEPIDIFSINSCVNIDQFLKEGWNDITIKTSPLEPATDENYLLFQIGPMHKDPENSGEKIVSPVVWEFDNHTDWKLANGLFTHPLGAGVKLVTLTHHFYWAGVSLDTLPTKQGDYVLSVKPRHPTNSPVIATLLINDKPLGSFYMAERLLNITSLLKPGKNEVKIITHRIKEIFAKNDIECSIDGPAEWSAKRRRYLFKNNIIKFSAMQGWQHDQSTGQLINTADSNAEMITQTIPFEINDPLPNQDPKAVDSKTDAPAEKEESSGEKGPSF